MLCSHKAVGRHVYLATYSQASVADLWCLVLCDIYHILQMLWWSLKCVRESQLILLISV